MKAHSLPAETREGTGKGAARKIRMGGMIPAVIYRGGGEPLHISVDPKMLEMTLKKTRDRNTIFSFDLEDGQHLCLVKDSQRHPLKQNLLHVDFFEVLPEEHVEVKVRLNPTGRAVGTRHGGSLQVLRREVKVRCLPADIPVSLSVDVTHLDLGDFVKVDKIPAPEGVTVLFDTNFNVFGVAGRLVEEEAEEADEEVSEEA